MNLAQHIGEQARRVNRRPTDGQKLAGNYRKGHIRIHGLDITIENPQGSWRSGTSLDGKVWRSQLPFHYGYIKRTTGADGDHLDVFVGPHHKSQRVFVIDQHALHGPFDEHKAFIGFASEGQAKKAYIRAFSDGKGRQRIGHVASLSVDDFKHWLSHGNTLYPIKGRAAGGRVGYADGGAPVFDPSQPFEPVQPEFDPTKPYEPISHPTPPDAGMLDAAGRGLRAGATMNFGDELVGARANASDKIPEQVAGVPWRTMYGVGKTAYGYATGNKEIMDTYEKARDAERKADEEARARRPYTFAGSELAGAVPAMAALPELGAAKSLAPAARGIAKFGARALDSAVTGGQYGMLSGAGEGSDMADRAVRGATGIVSGIVGGAGGQAVGEGIGGLLSKYGAPVVRTVRGWLDPNGEASRRLATALRSDSEMIANGQAQGLTPQQWVMARRNGEPVTLADLGAARTQALLRSAANTSPEGRAMLEQMIEGRFLTQQERVADTVRNALPGGAANARKSADQLVAEYDAARTPAYKAAYQQGDRPLMSPAMERLMSSDTFVGAMKRAISSGKDRDAVMGLGGFNPQVMVTQDGRIVFNRGANGVPTYPNLQYWDQVKRELDAVANVGKRSGDNERADIAGQMSRILRGELDRQVPAYSQARGVAEKYFGESNALEAGRKLAGKKMAPEDVQKIMVQMKPDERELFREGYASDLADRVIGNMAQTTNITKGRGLMASPNERRMATTIFGPGGMAQIEARMHLERIMDGARQAMGNSTTVQQLIEAGLAGGVGAGIEGFSSGWDPTHMAGGFGAGAVSRFGANLLKDEVRVGAKHLIGKVDARTARRVAELLTSNDPRELRAGYQMAAKSERIMQGLRNISNRIGVAGSTSVNPAAGGAMRALQGPMGAAAGDEQQHP